jgi:hypothetical protein
MTGVDSPPSGADGCRKAEESRSGHPELGDSPNGRHLWQFRISTFALSAQRRNEVPALRSNDLLCCVAKAPLFQKTV